MATDPTTIARPVESLTRLEKAWLKRRECGWCSAPLTARRCQAMYSEPCDMDMRRGQALQDYKPRLSVRTELERQSDD